MKTSRSDELRKQFLIQLRNHPRIGWLTRILVDFCLLFYGLDSKSLKAGKFLLKPCRTGLDRLVVSRTPDQILRENHRKLVRRSLIDSLTEGVGRYQ